jgi:hypothetical protein
MLASIAATEADESVAERYESLIRIATSIRSQKDPRELFAVLVHELGKVVHFDAIAQFDEASNKVAYHLGPGCQERQHCPEEIGKEDSIPAWVYEHQETLVLGALDRETRFGGSTRIMQRAGVRVSANYRKSPSGQPGHRQRPPQCLFTGRGSILRLGGQPDRPCHGRRHQLS